MEEITKWCVNNYGILIAGFVLLEKVVKVTPTKFDDILLDMILKPIVTNLKKGTKK